MRLGFFSKWLMRAVEFVTLNAFGSGIRWLIFWVNSLDSLKAGALGQLTTGQMCWSVLCVILSSLLW
jgi:hypothetical protein